MKCAEAAAPESSRPLSTIWSGEVTSIGSPVSSIVIRSIRVARVAEISVKSPTAYWNMSSE